MRRSPAAYRHAIRVPRLPCAAWPNGGVAQGTVCLRIRYRRLRLNRLCPIAGSSIGLLVPNRLGENTVNRIGMRGLPLACLALFGLAISGVVRVPQAHAMLTQITIESVEPFANGAAFGAAGAYERVVGTARGQVDPGDPRNRGIVNLEKAPRNARGWVEYATEFYLLRPADPAKGNGTILYEVNNRGRKLLMTFFMDAGLYGPPTNDPKTVAEVGNGLLLRQGYTLVWSGWDPDAPRANGGLAMTAPVALQDGQPIVRTIREELSKSPRLGPKYLELDRFRLAYEAAALDTKQARLTVRHKEADPRAAIPPERWTFVDGRTIKLLPEGTQPDPGALYELVYAARGPKVLGLGFAATRDFVSAVRHGGLPGNPVQGEVKAVLAVGVSQSGRFLRNFISDGFNQDEHRRKVFDGVLSHIAGVGRVFFNAEFGEPFRTNTQHEDHFYPENEFPFSTATLADPVTGKRGSLFRNDGFDPLLIEVNTSTEYWQKGASLLTTDPFGQHDLELPANSRVFMVAGTQHAGAAGQVSQTGPCLNPRNPHSPAPALRALLSALDAWVVRGVAPPPSRVPRIADGSAVAPDATGFPALPGVAVVSRTNPLVRFEDWIHPVAATGAQYRALVARVDADGNEAAGIRLPDIAAPLGTHTGWNLFRFPGLEGELCDRDGTYVPFAKTKAERLKSGDPRPSLEERYGTRAAYVAKLAAAAEALVKERLLLPEDAERYVEAAKLSKAFD